MSLGNNGRQKERGDIEANLPRTLDSPVTISGLWGLHHVRRDTFCEVKEKETGMGVTPAQPADSSGDHICLCQLLSVCVSSPRITAMIFTLKQLPSQDLGMLHKWRWELPESRQEGTHFVGHRECIAVLSAPFAVEKERTSFKIDLFPDLSPSWFHHSFFRWPGTAQFPSLTLSFLLINEGIHLPLNDP